MSNDPQIELAEVKAKLGETELQLRAVNGRAAEHAAVIRSVIHMTEHVQKCTRCQMRVSQLPCPVGKELAELSDLFIKRFKRTHTTDDLAGHVLASSARVYAASPSEAYEAQRDWFGVVELWLRDLDPDSFTTDGPDTAKKVELV